MWRKTCSLLVTLTILTILGSRFAIAASSPTDLVISEVLYDATGSSESNREWIEVKNKGSTDINITATWRLCDSAGCVTFPGAVTVPAGEYRLVVKDKTSAEIQNEVNLTGTWTPADTIDMQGSWRQLNNTGDVVRIYDDDPGAGGTLMDCVSWGTVATKCTGAGGYGGGTDTNKSGADDGQSISKIGEIWDYSKKVSVQTYGGSPYGPNTWADSTTVITLSSFTARSEWRATLTPLCHRSVASLVGAGLMVVGAGLTILKRRRPT